MELVVSRLDETVNQPDLLVDAPQNQGAKIRRQRPAVERGAHGQASDGRKSQRLWGRLRHGRPRLASPKRYWRNTHYINELNEVRPFL